jgi:signal transduction histidine kinase/DNA-binding response OmpR family regulator
MTARPVRILNVDDYQPSLYARSRVLRDAGFDVREATTGRDALRLAATESPDLVILDVNLPDMTGFEVCRRIKTDPGTASVLVLHLSATSVRENDRVRGLEFGADNYLIEPIQPDELIANVHALLRMRRAEQVARAAAEEAERRRREADVLTDLIRSINATLALDVVLEQVARGAMLLCGSDGARIAMRDPGTGVMVVSYRLEADGKRTHDPPVAIEPGRGIGGQVLATGRPFRTADYAADPRITKDYVEAVQREGVVAALAVPITLGPGLEGILYVVNRTAREFTDRDEEVLQRLADHAAIAIRNSQLFAREQAARAEAEAANRAKDEFLATVSHELRTPLMAMVGWVQLLRAAPLDEALRARAIETISRNARVQTQLVDDLLDVSRIISGKLRLEPRPVDLPVVVSAAVDAVRPAAEAKGIVLDAVLDGRVGAVAGDADRLQQVVWNLLSNAVKFTPAGGRVTVTLSRRDGETEVRVSDTGQGIEPEFLPYVFDRFRQADNTSVRRHGGLGLGLAIARHLVELHGGQVRVDSPGEGRGSTFSVRLPATPPPGASGGGPAAASTRAAPATAGPPPPAGERLDGVRVLVVEDDPDARELIRLFLAQVGAVVVSVESVGEALAAMAGGTPDVVVADIAMPGEDGYALLRRLRALPPGAGAEIPVVAVTAYARNEDRTRTAAAGFAAHLTKPIDPAELVDAIGRLAGRGTRA